MNPSKKDRCTLIELERAIKPLMPKHFADIRYQIKQAYTFVKMTLSSRGALGIDYIEKRELRTFLVALKQRLEYLNAFKNYQGQKPGEVVNVNDFVANKAFVEKWGLKIAVPVKQFDGLKKNGVVTFDDMCDWSCRVYYDKEGDKF
jgi:hypothetical protein